MGEPYLGEIRMFGFDFAPRGWAFCQGQLISVSENADLFSLLGVTYGGDGLTTFGLPDLRGRVGRGFGTGAGLSAVAHGAVSGVESVTLDVSQTPAHTHDVRLYAETTAANSALPGNRMLAISGANSIYASPVPADESAMATESIREDSVGGGGSFDVVNPYLGVNYCICTRGRLPSDQEGFVGGQLMNFTTYPVASDLLDHVDVETASAALSAQAADFVAEATETMLARVPVSALPAEYRPGGDAEGCPWAVKRAIVMYAGRLFARRASLTGVQSFSNEDFVRISNVDPDIERLMAPWVNWLEA